MDSPFHKFCTLIRSLDLNDDSIVLDHNLKYLTSDINEVLEGDENILWSALLYFNDRALADGDFAINFALLFTSHHFDGLKEHLQSSDGNSIFRAHILNMLQLNYSNAEKLKAENMQHFYNSITLLGEFYNRLHHKTHPVLIMGRSLFELLTKQLKNETQKCSTNATHVFDVQFARLILTQVTLNGALARPYHANEIDALFFELRKCLIEIPNLTSVTKAFLLMTLDLYYSGFQSIGLNLENFYGKLLDEHDNDEKSHKQSQTAATESAVSFSSKGAETTTPSKNSYSLRNLQNDFAGLKSITTASRTNGGASGQKEATTRINREYLNRPLKASDRLKYMQHSNSELSTHQQQNRRDANDDALKSPRSLNNMQNPSKEISSDIIAQPPPNLNNNATESSENYAENSKMKCSPLLMVSTNCPESVQNESVTSPNTSLQEPQISLPKFEKNFNWFEAVENATNDLISSSSFHNSGDSNSSNKFDSLSVTSHNSNPTSPQKCNSPHSSLQPNRSRRNSLNRFRSEYYKQSNEDLHQQQQQNNDKRPMRGDANRQNPQLSQQNYQHQSWRSSGQNSPRNGYNKRIDYDRDGPNNNNNNSGRNDNNYNRRNLVRGGSVDSKIKDFGHGRNRHDSYNRRNQENDNFEHFQSYNRKSHPRSKDTYMNNSRLPPRLQQAQQQKLQQQKLQQQQQRPSPELNSDCDNNSKRFNKRSASNPMPSANNTSTNVSGNNNHNKNKYLPKTYVGGSNNSLARRDNDFD